ncbi:phosphoribosylaminoimidazolesuccinocarboxamide synthase [Marinicella sp. S1101]|uniref:phosphoribosylaminoimidazolesuccinocarboxamide synthase n=1 Tax=Marinicella marina TaxID=2996016 RepID=UPI002260B465|nr:phosphoribosylaminoimidazolesuccinocarboxamide synthase [Marinicella marina]MCX7554562.1 phosphoribosylaminoimidazolesuccinocarboxamide synthase [Marinicella marina]MDJ1141054.1 phosphoribosylaminoimidazolesuccinocarboxamide synthase [Marinicella marina]
MNSNSSNENPVQINLPLLHRGKVRDVYEVDDQHLLMVASDRLSAFDVVLPDTIPHKGALLTQISNYWFAMMAPIIKNHLTEIPVTQVIPRADKDLQQRAVVVKKLRALPCEAIVRGYIIGSGWKDYLASGQVCGIKLPEGLKQAEQLHETLFTPSSKAAVGDHDENITFGQLVNLIGQDRATQLKDVSLTIYEQARQHAEKNGIIIADTKFEFGIDEHDELVLMDEVLTPDSSRFWNQDNYQVDSSPESYDKQFIRDYLETLDWDKQPPGPHVPDELIEKTAQKYHEAYRRITGKEFLNE